MRGQAIRNLIEEILKSYQALLPDHWEAFLSLMESERSNLIKPSGMSKGGHFMIFAKFPAHLYSFIKWQMRKRAGIPDFFASRKNYELLAEVCEAIRMRTKPTKI